VKHSPKDAKVTGGSKVSSLKRAGSKDILGSPPAQGSKAAKKEASPGVDAPESGKKSKRKRAASAVYDSGDNAEGADVAAPRRLKLAKTGLPERYFLCVRAPHCH
jgi:hypothetical protein